MMLTVVTPYFEDEEQLTRYLSQDCFDLVDEVIIIDDGSEVENAKDIVRAHLKKQIVPPHCKFRVLRVAENLGFNGHGCRNLGVQQASNEWVFLVDVDIAVDKKNIELIREAIPNLQENQFLGMWFSSPLANGKEEPVEYNSYVIRKEHFLATRGYDEEFVNIHGGSRVFVERLMTKYERVMLDGSGIGPTRYGREIRVVEGQEKTEYDDHFIYHPHTWDGVEELLEMARERNKHPETWKDKTFINFDWYEEKL